MLLLDTYGIVCGGMKSLVLYDSNFGNTKVIAQAIAKTLGTSAVLRLVSEYSNTDLNGIQLLIVGSPINGWKPTEKMGKFLDQLQPGQLKGIAAASFDTRINLFFHGDATKKIAAKLEAAGAQMIANPQAFIVKGTEGPLEDGELERAKIWATNCMASVTSRQ